MEGAPTPTKKSRVLALSARPRHFHDLIGQEKLVASMLSQFESKRIPHFFILSGGVGSGKTTLARILSIHLQNGDYDNYKKYDIREINAANQTGVDDMRAIIESMRFQPIAPSKVKIVILDEAHQLSVAAQNVLITETEDVNPHVFYIFCTSIPSKIIDALKRRAFHLTPAPLSTEKIQELIQKTAESIAFTEDTKELLDHLIAEGISSPGLILQACERFFVGLPLLNATNPNLDSLGLCRSVASGNWELTKDFCRHIGKSDIIPVKVAVSGYLRAILIKGDSDKDFGLANAIKYISDALDNELPSFTASLYMACFALMKKK
jgi:DNA polymerase III delta prime subunit